MTTARPRRRPRTACRRRLRRSDRRSSRESRPRRCQRAENASTESGSAQDGTSSSCRPLLRLGPLLLGPARLGRGRLRRLIGPRCLAGTWLARGDRADAVLAARVAGGGLTRPRLFVARLPVAGPVRRVSAVAARPGLPAPAWCLVLTRLRAAARPVALAASVARPGLPGPDRGEVGELPRSSDGVASYPCHSGTSLPDVPGGHGADRGMTHAESRHASGEGCDLETRRNVQIRIGTKPNYRRSARPGGATRRLPSAGRPTRSAPSAACRRPGRPDPSRWRRRSDAFLSRSPGGRPPALRPAPRPTPPPSPTTRVSVSRSRSSSSSTPPIR